MVMPKKLLHSVTCLVQYVTRSSLKLVRHPSSAFPGRCRKVPANLTTDIGGGHRISYRHTINKVSSVISIGDGREPTQFASRALGEVTMETFRAKPRPHVKKTRGYFTHYHTAV